ncbi:MAG TPA: DUF2267 domain-containing protein [Chloroflexi bacterium]|nr:DUF2267 domain-containing protein [Chloroflexota bacterium]
MQHKEFVGQVQHRARLATEGEAVRAVRATLNTLAERLFGNEAENLAAQSPREIGHYAREMDKSESFDVDEFFRRVAEREELDLPVSMYHAQAVISVLEDAVSKGEMDDVRAQLPDDYGRLFEYDLEERSQG